MSSVLRREELFAARLELGGAPMELADYATTGLRLVFLGPSGSGKTNGALLVAEQLAEQGWLVVMIDPENELERLYGTAVADPVALTHALTVRDRSVVVVSARDAEQFIPYGRVILEAADRYRKPILVVLDEAELFSMSRKRSDFAGEASDIVNEFAQRGRKRCLDLCVTALRCSNSLNRAIFNSKNATFIGRQEDPTTWSQLAPLFRGSRIEFPDLAALAPGEFFAFTRTGVQKIVMPMAKALAEIAPKATTVHPALPATYTQWDRAMRQIPDARLRALTDPVVSLLGQVAGLTAQQMLAGGRALADEREARA